MRNLLSIIVLLLILSSCEPQNQVKFQESQPAQVRESKGFRSNRVGVYVNYRNPKKTINIQKTLITQRLIFQFKSDRNKIQINKLADVDRQNDSALTAYFKKLGGEIQIKGDEITYSQGVTDTIFRIDSTQILKQYKRSYYLNYKTGDGFWSVYRIKFKGDTLLYGEITPSDTLLAYDYTRIDSIKGHPKAKDYVLTPNKKELRKLMRSDAFKYTEKYIKQ